MTPYEIEIVLHYFYSPEEHPDCRGNSTAWRENIEGLQAQNLLRLRTTGSEYGATYETTERGNVYVQALREMPLPEQRWVMPGAGT